MPKFITHPQRSPEWFAWRKNKVTASNAAAIMGLNPHKTALQLYTQLLDGVETPVNDAMERGIELEPEARKWAENYLGFDVPESCAEDDELSWLAASLDGYNHEHKTAIEIKCMGKKGHHEAKLGVVKPFYMPQLQCQMKVYNLDKMYYVSYDPEEGGEIIKVQRDDLFIEKMLPLLADFRKRLISFDPPDPTDKDLVEVNDRETCLMAIDLKRIKSQRKALEEHEDELTEALIQRLDGKSSLLGKDFSDVNMRMVKFSRKGNVQYDKIDVLKDIDLDAYRKAPTTQWRLS